MIQVNNNDQAPDGLYAEYANNFDLSLLPMDNEIELLSNLERNQIKFEKSASAGPNRCMNSFTPPSSPEYIPTSVYEAFKYSKEKSWTAPSIVEDDSYLFDTTNQQQLQYQGAYLPHQSKILTPFPPSPTPSIDFSRSKAASVKQEASQSNYLGVHYPLSPPDSNGAPSPIGHHYICDFKTEPIDSSCSEASVDINHIFPNTFDLATHTLTPSTSPLLTNRSYDATNAFLTIPTPSTASPSEAIEEKRDHQLLREYLQDTSFQKKHNLKPLALETLFVGDWTSRDDIEPMISLALEHARKDVLQTCNTLDISAG